MTKSKWTTEHGGIVSKIISKICTAANLSYADIPNILVLHEEIFGIPMTYERKVFLDDHGDIQEFCYSLCTDNWTIKMSYDTQNVLDPNAISKLVWNGTGNYDRWARDIIVAKLHGL